MALELWYVGFPVPEQMPGMVYSPEWGMAANNPDQDKFHFQYMYYPPDSPYPPEARTTTAIGYKSDDLEADMKDVDEIGYGPVKASSGTMVVVRKNGLILHYWQFGRR
ncbi:MAG: hypothetical protein LBL92_02505 [Propionibacteriaceae bacterium]|jgi:hypothetical protein|nr:hypothetical protein [Propionibacteriaceae bacterium]